MEKKRKLYSLVVLGVFFYFLPSTGGAAIIPVNCDTGGVIQTAISGATSGDTISVTGTCTENVNVNKGLILEGNSSAEIHAADADTQVIKVNSGSVTISNFASIQGGTDGVWINGHGPTINNNTIQNNSRDGIFAGWGANPTINSNTIQNNARMGITVYANSFAVIINNTITLNTSDGIYVTEGGVARIGFSGSSDTIASTNTISSNGGAGIIVTQAANARIVGNIINNNTAEGISVNRLSHADIASNTIDGNENGITVSSHSFVNLGSSSGTSIFDMPNNTTTVNNDNMGVTCAIKSYVTGRFGTLIGANGVISYSYEGIGVTSPIYKVDVSGGNVSRSQLHFSLSGTDTGGWITSVLDNNFFLSSGAVWDQGAGGWVQKSSDGNAVIAGSGSAGYRVFTRNGCAVGNVCPTFTRMTIDYSGRVGFGVTPTQPLQMANGAYVSSGGVWTDASSIEYKENIETLELEKAKETLKDLRPVTYKYKANNEEKHVGFIAEDVPDLVATKDRKGLSPMDIVAVLTKVVQEQQKTISTLREELDELKGKVR